MKTNPTSDSLAEKISNMLKKAQIEIEEFALQFTLGKADASVKFEEVKKEFHNKSAQWKQTFSNLKFLSREKTEFLKSKLEELEVQLSLGKAEAKDFFAEQKKRILTTIHQLETELKDSGDPEGRMSEFKNEIEKLKLKLAILELQFELKTLKGKDKFMEMMANARIEIDKLTRAMEDKWNDAKSHTSDFSDEISKSYEHLKKAIRSL